MQGELSNERVVAYALGESNSFTRYQFNKIKNYIERLYLLINMFMNYNYQKHIKKLLIMVILYDYHRNFQF